MSSYLWVGGMFIPFKKVRGFFIELSLYKMKFRASLYGEKGIDIKRKAENDIMSLSEDTATKTG